MAVQIPAEIESQIEALTRRTDESKNHLAREALLSFLEGQEDIATAKEYLLHPGDIISLGALKKNLGLERVLQP